MDQGEACDCEGQFPSDKTQLSKHQPILCNDVSYNEGSRA